MYLTSISSRLVLHDTDSWDLKKSYGCYEGLLRDISWSDDSKYLLQINAKGVVEVLSANDRDVRSLQHIPLKDAWSASFHRDGHRNIAVGTRSGNVLLWDTKSKNITKTFLSPPQQSVVKYVSFNAKNSALGATLHNGDTIVYSLISNIPVLTVKLSSKSISAMKFHHESKALLGLATEEGHMVFRDIRTNKDKASFENVHASPISDFTYSLVNNYVALSSGYDKLMHVYDVRLQNVVSTTRTSEPLTSVAINIDNQVALGTRNGSVLVYDLRDLTDPFKVLNCHNNEVKKVAFQPDRRRRHSTEVSLAQDTDAFSTPLKVKSPVLSNQNSDIAFYVNDSPVKVNTTANLSDNEEDSFLALMGLDNSYNAASEIENSPINQSNPHLDRLRHIEPERDMSKASTPFNSNIKGIENSNFVSPVCAENGLHNDEKYAEILVKDKIPQDTLSLDVKMEDLKDFVKLHIADLSDDNRNHFLHIMMALTKQKLYLEKELGIMSTQINNLVQKQNAMMEMNHKLLMEVIRLKNYGNFQ